MAVIVLLADGLRVDTLRHALDDGTLPSIDRLRERGALHEVTSTFPSVTGPAYSPFLLGRFPGSVGLPGLRWYDRSRRVCGFPGHSRSYVGHQIFAADGDLRPDAPTVFDLVPESAAAMTMITRGLPRERRLTRLTPRSALRGLVTHFGGGIENWLAMDRDTARQLVARAHAGTDRYLFAAFMGVDKVSHDQGHASAAVQRALRIVDDTVGELLDDATPGRAPHRIWIASDHGHSPVIRHDDLHAAVAGRGHRALAHPWTWRPRADVAVMVSGNAMAHVYLELHHRTRPFWPALSGRWGEFADWLERRPSVDLLVIPLDARRALVRSATRGQAIVAVRDGCFSYERRDGDPLGVGGDLRDASPARAHDATREGGHPDAIVQIARLAESARAGDIIVSAAAGWDLRERFEPIPHVSTHGALLREHMVVPLLLDRPVAAPPRRTTDVMPAALAALGVTIPQGLDGEPFI